MIWSLIKGIWRDCVQDIRLSEIRSKAPAQMTVKHPHWQRYQVNCMKAIRQPVPDIPASLYTPLWESFEFGQSGAVKAIIRDYLLSNK